MKHWFWVTAVSLITILVATAACSQADEAELPVVTGPAFVLFYTDN
jgi:hypothetical protein